MSSKKCMPKAGDSTDAILDHDRIEVEEQTEDELDTRENSIGRGILHHKKNQSRKSKIEVKDTGYKCCGNKMRIFLSTLLVLTVFIGLGVSCLFRNPTLLVYPLHASCNVTWTFSKPCNEIMDKILDQIEAWKGDDICGEGQKCLYALVQEDENGKWLKATHTTPVRKYIDDLEFNFYTNTVTNGCNLIGFSTSRIWYAFLDYGTNYCNIHNLVSGAGLQDDEHYSELTRDEVCTQYTSANCEKY